MSTAPTAGLSPASMPAPHASQARVRREGRVLPLLRAHRWRRRVCHPRLVGVLLRSSGGRRVGCCSAPTCFKSLEWRDARRRGWLSSRRDRLPRNKSVYSGTALCCPLRLSTHAAFLVVLSVSQLPSRTVSMCARERLSEPRGSLLGAVCFGERVAAFFSVAVVFTRRCITLGEMGRVGESQTWCVCSHVM